MKRYLVYFEKYNDEEFIIFSCEKIQDALRYIADGVDGVEYPDRRDNSGSLYCYRLYDGNKTADDGEGNMLPVEVFRTDYFYK